MKLKQLLKAIDKDTYMVFETNELSDLGGAYKDSFKHTFRNHIYLDTEIKEIRASTIRSLFTENVEECLLITFKG